jgi:hypothetical protein
MIIRRLTKQPREGPIGKRLPLNSALLSDFLDLRLGVVPPCVASFHATGYIVKVYRSPHVEAEQPAERIAPLHVVVARKNKGSQDNCHSESAEADSEAHSILAFEALRTSVLFVRTANLSGSRKPLRGTDASDCACAWFERTVTATQMACRVSERFIGLIQSQAAHGCAKRVFQNTCFPHVGGGGLRPTSS